MSSIDMLIDAGMLYLLLRSRERVEKSAYTIVGTRQRFWLTAEKPGLDIKVNVYKPSGRRLEVDAIDIGDGRYYVDVDIDERGVWMLEAVFPDGMRVYKSFIAL